MARLRYHLTCQIRMLSSCFGFFTILYFFMYIMRFFLFSSFLIFTLVSTSSGNDVFEGVKNDDGDAIQSAVKADPSLLESIGPGGQTPLLHAVLTGKLNAVKTLLEINAKNLYSHIEKS